MRLPFARFVQELKRRKVLQATSLYIVTAWGISLGAAELLPAFGIRDEVVRGIVLTFIVLLPVVSVLAWYFDLSTEGFVRDSTDLDRLHSSRDRVPSATQKILENVRGTDIATSGLEITWQIGKESEKLVFTKAFCLGRDLGCEVSTPDPVASRRHAEIGHDDSRWWIRDLDSRNGTYLNGKRISREFLPSNCTVLLGENGQLFLIRVLGRDATTVSSAPLVTPLE